MNAPKRLLPLLAAALLVFAAGCDSGDDDDTASIEGEYEATTLTGVNEGGDTDDVLMLGGSLTLSIDETDDDPSSGDVESFGDASATFVVPAELSEVGREVTFSLSGTYTLESDGRLTFDFEQAEETFIGDIDWQYEDGVIRDDEEGLTVVRERQ